MWKEFKEFALKGNIVDLAVGVIIGGAFQKIVTSLVNDIIMPIIAMFTGKVDYNDLVFTFNNVSIKYGSFLTTVLDFLIVALSLFFVIRYINRLNKKLEKAKLDQLNNKFESIEDKLHIPKRKKNKKEEQVPEPMTKLCPYCCSEISIKATRCPHCTSVLEEVSVIKENSEETKKE